MKVCAYCGRENDDSARHCMECGTERFRPPASEKEKEPSKKDGRGSDSFVPRQLTDREREQAFVILGVCRNLAEADLLVNRLEAADVAAEIPDRALMEVFTCNVRVQVRTEQYDRATQVLADMLKEPVNGERPADEPASEKAGVPLDLSMKCLLFMLPSTVCPALIVGAWLRSHYAKQGYQKRADSIWLWLAAGFVFWLLFYLLFLPGRSR